MGKLDDLIDGLVSLAGVGAVVALGINGVTEVTLHGTILSIALGKPVVGKYLNYRVKERGKKRRERVYPSVDKRSNRDEGQ